MRIRNRLLTQTLAVTIGAGLALAGAVTGSAGDRVTTAVVPAGGQPLAAKTDSDGKIHLVFNTVGGPHYTQSADDGKTFSNPIAIVDRESRKPGLEFSVWDMAVDSAGRVHVALGTNAWKLKLPKAEWGFYYAGLEPDAQEFSAVRNVNRTPGEGVSLAADDKGRVTACWLAGKLYANVSRDNGKTFGPAIEIDPTIDPCNCCTTSAVYTADGRLAVLYREETNDQRDMFLVMWDQERAIATRTPVSNTLWKISACPMSYYAVNCDRDGFVAVWPTKDQIFFARLDGQGVPRPPGEIKTPGSTGMRTGMLGLTAADGSTLIAWKKSGQLSWQLYDQRGQPSGKLASAESAGNGVAGVVGSNGDFVLFR